MATTTPTYLNHDGETILLDLINGANTDSLTNGALTESSVTFGAPTAGTVGDDNTSIVVTAVSGQGYKDDVTVTYLRLDIQKDVMSVLAPSGAALTGNTFAKISDLIAPLNSEYKIGLVASDVANGSDALSLTDGAGTGTITIADASLKYIGTLAVTIGTGQISLTTAVANTTLPGLVGPTASGG